MKRNASKLLSTLLALCMALAMLPGTALAEGPAEEVLYQVEGGDLHFDKESGTITKCDTSVTAAVVPSEIDNVPVTLIQWGAFKDCTRLTSVTLPKGIGLGEGVFQGCTSLTSVTLSADMNILSTGTFYGCSSLASVTIPDSVIWIGQDAFYGCSGLTSVTIPDSVTEIGQNAFYGCSGLTSVTVPDSVTDIGMGAFFGCSGMTSVTLPANLTSISGYMFSSCSSLTSVTIPSSVTSIGEDSIGGCIGTFSGCDSLTAFNVESGNQNFASEDGVLFNKDKTTLICFPRGKGGAYTVPNGVKNVAESSFSSCKGLTSVTFPDGLTSIYHWAFDGCSNLSSVSIPASVTDIFNGAFVDCDSLKDIFYGGSEKDWSDMHADTENSPALYTATIHYNSNIGGGGNNNPGSDTPQDTSYRISFDTQTTSVTVSPMLTNSNGKLSSLPNPSRNGYKFDGWFTAKDGGKQITTETIFTRDTTVYAHWTRNTSNSEGTSSNGSSGGGSSKPSVRPGTAASTPVTPSAPATPSTPSSSTISSFGDVPAGTWYAEAVNYAVTHGIMNGTGNGNFSPNATTTRAMLMTMLARLNGVDTEGGSNWYEKSMQWATEKGISDGSNPNGSITREQLVTMLYRYQGSPAAEGSLDTFVDGNTVNDWAMDAMRWAVTNGIVQGSNGSINPAGNATRAEVAAILMRFCQQFSV